jgi:hypothetical protein
MKKKHKKRGVLVFIRLHRWLGLSSLLLLMILSITGIMLNHTEELHLGQNYISSLWLQQWYGIKMPKQQVYLKLGHNWVVQIGQQLYFNQQPFADEKSPLMGVYQNDDFYIVVMKNAIYLLTFEGELIEKLDSNTQLPIPINRFGLVTLANKKNYFALEINQTIFISEDNFLTWSDVSHKTFIPIIQNTHQSKDSAYYQALYLGNELSVERVVLDFHSGRGFGIWGIYIMDLVAIIMCLLGISGLWIWSKRLKKTH